MNYILQGNLLEKSYVLIKTITTTEMYYAEEIVCGTTARHTENTMIANILNDGDIIPVASNQKDVDIISAKIITAQGLHDLLDTEEFHV